MLGSVHLLFGALIGLTFSQPEAVVVVAFLSHYILDFLPHVDPKTFIKDSDHYSNIGFLLLISDIILVCLLTVFMVATKSNWQFMLLGAISAQIPDWLTPIEHHPLLAPLKRIHELSHWDVRRAQKWHWYMTGLLSPALIGILCMWFLW